MVYDAQNVFTQTCSDWQPSFQEGLAQVRVLWHITLETLAFTRNLGTTMALCLNPFKVYVQLLP
jgi:hypothetical protein